MYTLYEKCRPWQTLILRDIKNLSDNFSILTASLSSEKKLSVAKVCWRKKFLKLHEYVSINIIEVAESESEKPELQNSK